jgi:hypothetical protein
MDMDEKLSRSHLFFPRPIRRHPGKPWISVVGLRLGWDPESARHVQRGAVLDVLDGACQDAVKSTPPLTRRTSKAECR